MAAGGEPEFGEYVAEMVLNGLGAHEEFFRDLLVGVPRCGKPGGGVRPVREVGKFRGCGPITRSAAEVTGCQVCVDALGEGCRSQSSEAAVCTAQELDRAAAVAPGEQQVSGGVLKAGPVQGWVVFTRRFGQGLFIGGLGAGCVVAGLCELAGRPAGDGVKLGKFSGQVA